MEQNSSSDPPHLDSASQSPQIERDAQRSDEATPTLLTFFRSADALLEHAYGEGLHALLQNRPPEAEYRVTETETDGSTARLTIHRPTENEHAFVAIDLDTDDQFAFSGTLGEIVTALLRIYQSDFDLTAVTVPPELPDFDDT